MPKRDRLRRIATDFRQGILGTMPSARMCFAVCAPLEGYLRAALGVSAELVEGELRLGEDVAQHFWLELPDGRILDPTADQFATPSGEPMPEVYIGVRPGWYLTLEEAEELRHEESQVSPAPTLNT
jgi:hypothetical protein